MEKQTETTSVCQEPANKDDLAADFKPEPEPAVWSRSPRIIMGVIEGDTRSLDYSSYRGNGKEDGDC